MNTLKRGILAIVAAAMVFVVVDFSDADNLGKHDAPIATDWKEKVLVVFEKGRSSREPYYLENARLDMIGGRIFLVGKGLDMEAGLPWQSLGVRIGWESVSSFVEFDSREQFMQRHHGTPNQTSSHQLPGIPSH